MDLRDRKILNAQRFRNDGPNCRNCVASDTANQVIQGVVELKNVVGMDLLGIKLVLVVSVEALMLEVIDG